VVGCKGGTALVGLAVGYGVALVVVLVVAALAAEDGWPRPVVQANRTAAHLGLRILLQVAANVNTDCGTK
jgi:hypothetical protein